MDKKKTVTPLSRYSERNGVLHCSNSKMTAETNHNSLKTECCCLPLKAAPCKCHTQSISSVCCRASLPYSSHVNFSSSGKLVTLRHGLGYKEICKVKSLLYWVFAMSLVWESICHLVFTQLLGPLMLACLQRCSSEPC